MPVFDTVRAAWDAVGAIDISVIFVPAALVKDAALEALDAGIKLLVIVPDRVPIYDVLEIDARGAGRPARISSARIRSASSARIRACSA